jgi:hypothetical protein
MTMKSSDRDPLELESELIRLNTLIRARRKQLALLERCPYTECECRTVWREVTEKKLAGQVGKVRKHVRASHNGSSGKPKKAAGKSG